MPPTLTFDTETTGTDADRDRIVQLAAILHDDQGRERATMAFLIRPDGWTVPPGAAAVHGITTEIATANGVPLIVALSAFNHLCRAALVGVGHNVGFDFDVIEAEFRRVGRGDSCALVALDRFCTQAWSDRITRFPPTDRMIAAGYGWKNKPPKLSEAIAFLSGEALDGAHDALIDVRAAYRLHRLSQQGIFTMNLHGNTAHVFAADIVPPGQFVAIQNSRRIGDFDLDADGNPTLPDGLTADVIYVSPEDRARLIAAGRAAEAI